MATIYQIEGNEIRRIDQTVQQVGALSDLLPSLTTYEPLDIGRVPRNTSYIATAAGDANRTHFDLQLVITQDPQVRRILFRPDRYDERSEPFDIAMPFFHFWFNMRGTVQEGTTGRSILWAPRSWGTMWSRTPFRDLDTQAVSAWMPNNYRDTRVCFGNNPVAANLNLGEHVDALVNTYWTSVFNTDLDYPLPYSGAYNNALLDWAHETENNSDVWMTWDHVWQQQQPMKDLIQAVSGNNWQTPAPDSVEPVIPEVPTIQTFANIDAWLNGIDDRYVARLKAVLEARDDR